MRRHAKTIFLALLVLLPGPLQAADAGTRKFQEIASRLDIGGDLFLVMHTGRWLDEVLARLEGDAEAQPPASADERDLRNISGRARRFAARQGISGLEGVGVSSMPLQDGQSQLKIFLLRDGQDANLPFWRGLFGWQPRRLLSLDFLPADTALAWASTPDFEGLWQLLQSAADTLQEADLVGMLGLVSAASVRLFEQEPLPLLASLRDELLISFRYMPSAEPEALPVREWLVVLGTGEETLLQATRQFMASRGAEREQVEIAGRTMERLVASDATAGLPQACAFVPGFFVIGSSSRIVEDALLAQRHRSGLLARPEFVDAFRGQNMVNNGLLYVSQAGAERLRLRQEQHRQQARPDALAPFAQHLIGALTEAGPQGAVLALTLANWRQGIMISGRSGLDGVGMGSWLGLFPAAWWFGLPEKVNALLGE